MAEIIFSSSFDDRYPTSNILSSSTKDFWVSSGLYPQELFLQLDSERTISSMNLVTYAVKSVLVETCENSSAVNFTKQAEMKDIPHKEGKLQEFFLNFGTQKQAKIIKITILEGYEDFCSVHSIAFK